MKFQIPCLTAIAIQSCILNNQAQLKPFKVGLNSWSGYQIALYAKEAGLFRKHGLEVEFISFLSKQDELVRFIQAWFDVMKAVETKPQEVFASVGKQLNMTAEEFATDYQGLKKGDIAMNRRMFEGGRLLEAYQQTRQLLLSDPRHGRNIREDVEINAIPITKATKNWQS